MEAHISHIFTSYVIDPQVYGLDPSIWKTVSGTPAVVSNKYRLNTAEIITYTQYKYGDFEFNLTVPVAPTASDNRIVGLRSKSLGNRTRITYNFNSSGELRAEVYDKYGTLLFNEEIPWDTDWTNTPVLFRIGWQRNVVKFTISTPTGTELYTTTYSAGVNPLSATLFIDILNGNADNMDVASVSIYQANISNPVNFTDVTATVTSVTPGSGTADLGKVTDLPYSGGETGVLAVGVRNEAQSVLGDTALDHIPFSGDRYGYLYVQLASLIAGENQTLNRMMVTQNGNYTYISTATTTTVKSGSGVLLSIIITESVASTIIVYDNTAGSGTIIASFVASAGVNAYPINAGFSTGCTIVTAGASKLTAVWI